MAPAATSTAPAETKTMSNEQGLEKAATKTPAIITTPEEYRGSLLRWQEQHFNVLTPFTNISGIAPGHGIITSLIQISPEKSVGESYDGLPFLNGNEVALAKVGLRKLAECAGISTDTDRTDPRTIPNYWEFKATARYKGIDGATITRVATKEWDLRDGSPQMKGWSPKQVEEGRKHGLRNCEARAINAAIRECGCGIKQKYSKEELKKPFVVCRVMYQPDMSDPDIKRMVTAQALAGTAAMYPAPAPREHAPVAGGEVVDAETANAGAQPRQVGSGATTAATNQPKLAAPAEDRPPTVDAVKITKVESKEFVYQNGAKKGKKGLRFLIVDSTGTEYSTFDETHFKDAQRFHAANEWVEIATETNGQYSNIIEIVKAGTEPALPGLDEF
jgi:hypothetical protein